MTSELCQRFGIDFPLFAFSHCRDVVVEVSRAGGMGVFGAASMSPDELESELNWIDERLEGKPYGVDLLIPDNVVGKEEVFEPEQLLKAVPATHIRYSEAILKEQGVDASGLDEGRKEALLIGRNLHPSGAEASMEVAFNHPIRLIANALGVPPKSMLKRAKNQGVAVAALVGAKEHALRQAQAGVDIIVAAGGEAGGHCGVVPTMVLIPEVAEVLKDYPEVALLGAGGLVTGAQMAATMAMGAAGIWTASVWLTTPEAETNPVVKSKMLNATSRDTVRSKSRTGKPSRQLRSLWTDAWEAPDAPEPLPMPLQSLISQPALAKVDKLSQSGHEGAQDLATYWVGQGVGLMNSERAVRTVVEEFKVDFIKAYERLNAFLT
jgi:NAD(P)H-dependent flavin oxidoreductase YrpB (nitropropane dioxygenase family)